ncbi:MAG TPA: hypothetical protein VMW10_09065 [Alphaproteobacteria bacterium]|nr:hypothetical protein [Alphaproteobacteria bacterium]
MTIPYKTLGLVLSLTVISHHCFAVQVTCPRRENFSHAKAPSTIPDMPFELYIPSRAPWQPTPTVTTEPIEGKEWYIKCDYGQELVALLDLKKAEYDCVAAGNAINCTAK